MTTSSNAWTGMIPVDDTRLHTHDTGGSGRPLLYLNGCYADTSHWRRVIADLGDEFRHVTFDERARGKSGTSADYSFAACLRDVSAVIASRKLTRPILVGWSYGASLAAEWAAIHPGEAAGLVMVDGHLPYGDSVQVDPDQLRAIFKRLRLLLPLGARFGLAARMSWQQHAEVNIEGNQICARSAATLEALTCPTRYVLGTGGHLGTDDETMAGVRASLTPVLARNHHLAVSQQVASNHSKILSRDHEAVARAVREVAAMDGRA